MIAIWDLFHNRLSYIPDVKEEDWVYLDWYNQKWDFRIVYID